MSSSRVETVDSKAPSYLSKGHDVMFYESSAHALGVRAVVGDHDGDGGVELPHAADQLLQFVVAQECLGGHSDQSANVVLCEGQRSVDDEGLRHTVCRCKHFFRIKVKTFSPYLEDIFKCNCFREQF